jgi:hypothetical protein
MSEFQSGQAGADDSTLPEMEEILAAWEDETSVISGLSYRELAEELLKIVRRGHGCDDSFSVVQKSVI